MSKTSSARGRRTSPKADPTAARTTALASQLRDRADRRASRSVSEPLVTAPMVAVPPLVEPPADADATGRGRDAGTPAPGGATVRDPGAGSEHVSGQADPDAAAEEAPQEPAPETAGSRAAEAAATEEAPAAGDPTPQPEAAPETTGPQPTGSTVDRWSSSPRHPAVSATRPVAGPDGRLELSGERVDKMTLELPRPLVDALALWERDETKLTGQRVYRERLIDCALAQLPEDVDEIVDLARSLPLPLRHAETEQVGTRVRESIKVRLKDLRPELRVRRVKDVYLRHVYAAAIFAYLLELGVSVPESS